MMKWKNLRRFYSLYTSDLNLSEIERLIKRDVPGVYDFYVRNMEKPDRRQNRLSRAFTFARNLFITFLMKLTPARRLLYSISLVLFFYGWITARWLWSVAGFVILNISLALEVADKLTTKDELEVARDIQMNLMPKAAPSYLRFETACFSESAREVGGDYYDFIRPNHKQDSTLIVVGDVSGKGMPAALYMVQVQAILHHLAEDFSSPKDILTALHRNMLGLLRADYFISMSILAPSADGIFKFCRAGHMPLIHYQADSKKCSSRRPEGMAIGLERNGKFEKTLEEVNLNPARGDLLVLYTDGVVETVNRSGEEYGEKRFKQAICSHARQSAEGIKKHILADIATFRGTAFPRDDLTFVIIRI
jgi:sigma-B regulation protein RsbU (phosphoserine phosphatase)